MISEKYIMSLLKEYVKSDEGRKRFAGKIKELGGEYTPSRREMRTITRNIRKELYQAIHEHVKSFKPQSILISEPTVVDGRTVFNIGFEKNALFRESLHYYQSNEDGVREKKYTGAGIDDIVYLFEHGYTVHKKRPYGYWNTDQGEVWVSGKMHREPQYFLRAIVERMNVQYKDVCKVVLDDNYLYKR